MTTVDTLRGAAALMRKRAEAATEGGWQADNCEPATARHRGVLGNYTLIHDGEREVAIVRGNWRDAEAEAPDAAHIASWHSAVALAVADWLERSADWETPKPVKAAALAVASTYLGEAS